MQKKVFDAVMIATTIPMNIKDLFIVWSCYILGYRKFLVGSISNNRYFEVTYNRQKDEWYVDEYAKVNNHCIPNDVLEEYTKNNSNGCTCRSQKD